MNFNQEVGGEIDSTLVDLKVDEEEAMEVVA